MSLKRDLKSVFCKMVVKRAYSKLFASHKVNRITTYYRLETFGNGGHPDQHILLRI